MEFPHGNTRHQHHYRRDEGEEDPPPPPPPPRAGAFFDPPYPPYPPPSSYYRENEPPAPHLSAPPPPQVYDSFHNPHSSSSSGYYPPPSPPAVAAAGHNPSAVVHASHETKQSNQHHHRPHMPSFLPHHSHTDHKNTVRVYSKAETNHSLTIRDGKVILASSDYADPFQHWIKDEKFSTKVKDEQGFPSFALINKATGLAMKHSIGATHPVQLIPYNPDVLDESILWTESKDLGDGYKTIRMVNNIRLNVDAFNGDKNHGGVHDGTTIVLWEWKKGENQRWKIIPY